MGKTRVGHVKCTHYRRMRMVCMHSDSRFFLEDRQNAADAFVLRRVCPIVEGTLFHQFDFRVMPDFGGGTAVLQDASIEARLHPLVRIRTGKFKPPVGLERLASVAELLFIERALPTALVPNGDVGIAVHGERTAFTAGAATGDRPIEHDVFTRFQIAF